MKFLNKNIKSVCLVIISSFFLLCSCNKDVEQFDDIPRGTLTGKGIAATIAANANDSLFYRLIIRAGLVNKLNDSLGGKYTVFVPDNAAMIASGLSGPVVNGMPLAQVVGIVNYNIIPQKVTSSQISSTFPNMQLPTNIVLDPNPLVRMTTFLSKNGTQFYVNNIPLGQVDIQAANGVIHKPLRLVAPPTATLKGAMATEADLSLFRAAVARADVGQTGLSRFDSLLNYGVTNMTVLAPNNNAFKGLIYVLSGGLVPLAAPESVFINFINTNVPVESARGIIAYHLIATNPAGAYQPNIRVFSVNLAGVTQPFFLKTLVNASVAAHPGILAQATLTGPFGTGLKFTQYPAIPPATAPFSAPAANAGPFDKHAVNGVYHIIDQVLLPSL